MNVERRSSEPLKVVVVGGGMVGHRFCQVVTAGPRACEVVLLAEESVAPYDRVHLGAVLAGGEAAAIALTHKGAYEERGVELVLGDAVQSIDRDARVVRTRSGRERSYDLLVLATGARARSKAVVARGAVGR